MAKKQEGEKRDELKRVANTEARQERRLRDNNRDHDNISGCDRNECALDIPNNL